MKGRQRERGGGRDGCSELVGPVDQRREGGEGGDTKNSVLRGEGWGRVKHTNTCCLISPLWIGENSLIFVAFAIRSREGEVEASVEDWKVCGWDASQ